MMKRAASLVLVLVLIFVAIIAGCGSPTPTPEPPTPTPAPTEFPDPVEEDCPDCLEPVEYPQEGKIDFDTAYIPDQIILTGQAGAIEEVVRGVEGLLDPEPVYSVRLDYLEQYPDAQARLREIEAPEDMAGAGRLLAEDPLNVATSLYRRNPDSPLTFDETVEQIAAMVEELGLVGQVFVDLNYVTGFLLVENEQQAQSPAIQTAAAKGNRLSRIGAAQVGATPWGIEGGPWGIEGGGDGAPAPTDSFWNQWAFNATQGVSLFDGSGRRPSVNGRGVLVGVFDSSPFAKTAKYSINWITPALSLKVSHTVPLPASAGTVDISDHGLFVAGLIHAVAPSSEIQLIRVLNEYGQGDLFSLIAALNKFNGAAMKHGGGSMENVVYNLSLVIQNDEALNGIPAQSANAIRKLARSSPVGTSLPTMALEAQMLVIRSLGGVVVAAAGNDSAPNPAGLPARLPAGYSTVIGVAAANQSRLRSCYSNLGDAALGDVMAPGGEGGVSTTTGQPCVPAADQCTAPNCSYAVISLTLKQHRGYSFWVGSSFAAPLVSGLMALELESGTAPLDLTNPATLRTAISLSGAVVNVDASLP